ncbi:O-antigen ligase [Pseudonocardia sediminis]|uniref:O-antigen ligase n=1 Tax=Pseudonocardia sediminis TaxID=1397368 RepID=A0A4Q7V0F9_PSEST|nr:O-antigen ligase [Pseudonocardia sediminis]
MTAVLTRPGALVREIRTDGVEARLLQALAFLTVALSSFEGYLLEINDTVTKIPAGLLVVAWFVVRVRQRRLPAFHPAHVALAVLAVAVLASAAIHNGDTFTLDYTQRWVSFLLTALVLLDLASREVPVRVLVWASVLGAAVAGGGALWSFLIDDSPRATGPMEDPNDLAYVLVSAVPLLVALFVPRRRRDGADGMPRRSIPRAGAVLIGVLVLILVLGAAVTVSRGGLIALTVAVTWLALRRGIAPRVMVGVGAVVVVAGAVMALAFSTLVGQALSQKDQVAGSNVDTRALRWQIAAEMLPEHPLLGVGPGGFRSNYLGVSHNAELEEQTPVAHNMYVEVAAELGLLGLAGFLGLIGVALWSSEKAVRAARAGPDRLLPLAVQCSLIAVLVASTFLSEQYYMPLWSMIAAACALGLRNGTEAVR